MFGERLCQQFNRSEVPAASQIPKMSSGRIITQRRLHFSRQLTLADRPLHVAHDEAVLVVKELDANLGHLREQRNMAFRVEPGYMTDTAARSRRNRAWPREPVRPMTFMTMASLTGASCGRRAQSAGSPQKTENPMLAPGGQRSARRSLRHHHTTSHAAAHTHSSRRTRWRCCN